MRPLPIPSREELSSRFNYDREAGNLIWKPKGLEHFIDVPHCWMWHKRFSGEIAGFCAVGKHNRRASVMITMNVDGKQKSIPAHRIIWTIVMGEIPSGMLIDHIDGNPWNNKINNLRLATYEENARNRKRPFTNKCGLKGASRIGSRYVAQIDLNGTTKRIGTYDTPEQAHEAYKEVAAKEYGEFCRFE